MELFSVLLLLGCLFLILYLSYYINNKQKKRNTWVEKQEPRFNAHINLRHNIQENYQSDTQEFDNETIFLEENKSNIISKETNTVARQPKKNPTAAHPDEMIYLILLAEPNKPFVGYELLQALLSAGLRYGPMNIFHYYDDTHNGKTLFSVASAQEPGVFEITRMGGYSVKGLMIFIRFSQNKDLLKTLDLMIDVTKQLSEDLGGQIYDDEKQLLTTDKIEKWRKKILAFERRQVNLDLFEQIDE